MLDTIEYSIKHFFKHILKAKLETTKSLQPAEYYGASVSLSDSEKEFNCYLMFNKISLDELAISLLGKGAAMNEDDYCDLCKEVANQIIGYAKRLLADAYDDYEITVPEYLGRVDVFALDFVYEFNFLLNGQSFKVGIAQK